MAEEAIVPVTQVVEEPKTETVTPGEVTPTPVKGIPYEQYHKLLREKKELEAENESLKNNPPLSEDVYSDEGKLLKSEITELKSALSDVTSKLTKQDVLGAHPELKDKWSELEEFRNLPDNKGMNLKTAAKAFMIENGLLEPTRKGVEKPTGGPKSAPILGMSTEDVKTLRETNFKKYSDMLIKGQIKID